MLPYAIEVMPISMEGVDSGHADSPSSTPRHTDLFSDVMLRV